MTHSNSFLIVFLWVLLSLNFPPTILIILIYVKLFSSLPFSIYGINRVFLICKISLKFKEIWFLHIFIYVYNIFKYISKYISFLMCNFCISCYCFFFTRSQYGDRNDKWTGQWLANRIGYLSIIFYSDSCFCLGENCGRDM